MQGYPLGSNYLVGRVLSIGLQNPLSFYPLGSSYLVGRMLSIGL